jgi:hypothetical protein
MKKYVKVTIVLFSLLALGIAIYAYAYFNLGMITIEDLSPAQEKILVHSVFYNSTQNSVSVVAQAMYDLGKNSIFDALIVKDIHGNNVATIPISETLNGLEPTTLIVKLDKTLHSGTYTVVLGTSNGSFFVSPNFTVP